MPSPIGPPEQSRGVIIALRDARHTSNEARGVLGSALLEETFILRCLSARVITEAAYDQARHAPLPADLRHRRAFHLGRIGFELFAQRVLLATIMTQYMAIEALDS